MNFNKINVLLKMGRYFGIGNSTKKQQVSSYWKSDEFCDCYRVMHQMHWNKTDKIYSGCYDTCCEFKYDVENDVMNVIDVTDKMYQEYEENNDKEKEKEEKDDTIETKQYGFDTNLSVFLRSDAAPDSALANENATLRLPLPGDSRGAAG